MLFLTAKDSVDDRIAGLTSGGDDYVTKPFSLEEVVARLRGLIRRSSKIVSDAVAERHRRLIEERERRLEDGHRSIMRQTDGIRGEAVPGSRR